MVRGSSAWTSARSPRSRGLSLRSFVSPDSFIACSDGSKQAAEFIKSIESVAETIRINKFFTEHGICSRREADRLIEAGRVTINNVVAKLGDQVSIQDVIARDGQVIPWG